MSLPECIPRESATALREGRKSARDYNKSKKSYACSAAISLSYSDDRSSSSRLCRTIPAKPFSMSCSAMLLYFQIAQVSASFLLTRFLLFRKCTYAFCPPYCIVAHSRSSKSPSRGRMKSMLTLTCLPMSFLRRNSLAS